MKKIAMADKDKKTVSLYPGRSFLQIIPYHYFESKTDLFDLQIENIKHKLLKIMPESVLDLSATNQWLKSKEPVIFWFPCKKAPDIWTVSFISLPKKNFKVEAFFLEVIKKNLLEESHLQLASFHNFSFKILENERKPFIYSEASVFIEKKIDIHFLNRTLPLIKQQVLLGLKSRVFASFIIHKSPTTFSHKISSIFNDLIQLTAKFPNLSNEEIFSLMHEFLIQCKESFCIKRPTRLFSKVAYTYYLLKEKAQKTSEIQTRIFPSKISYPFGEKKIYCLLFIIPKCKPIALRELDISKAIKKINSSMQPVKGSYFSFKKEEFIRFHYIELESTNSILSAKEIKKIKTRISDELIGREKDLIPSIFNSLSEKEYNSTIFLLADKIKYLSDPSQMWFCYENEEADYWHFKILIVYLEKAHHPPLSKLIKSCETITLAQERKQIVEYVNKKTPKVSAYIKVKVIKNKNIAEVFPSILFSKENLLKHLEKALGPIEICNGTILLEQFKVFYEFKRVYIEQKGLDHKFLETFFYSINPLELQVQVPLEIIKKLFSQLLTTKESKYTEEEAYLFFTSKQFITQVDSLTPKALFSTRFEYQSNHYLGMVFHSKDQSILDNIKDELLKIYCLA